MHWFAGHLESTDQLTLSTHDPALLYGASVFTTLRVYESNLDHPCTAWDQHCDRLRQSLKFFGWFLPDWSRVRAGAEQLANHYPVLRITIFPDGRELIIGREFPADLPQRQTQGITAWVANPDYRRPLPVYKTGNYLSSWLALQAAIKQGAQEAILINDADHWLETSTGNLWGWTQGTWWTPPLAAGILPGIARSRLLQALHQQGQVPNTVPWTPAMIHQFEALAYSNAVVECIPIHTVLAGQTRLEYDPKHPVLATLVNFLRPSPAF